MHMYICKINISQTHLPHIEKQLHNAVATAEDSPLATKLKKTWLRTPVGEEQAAQAVLDPSIGTNWQSSY